MSLPQSVNKKIGITNEGFLILQAQLPLCSSDSFKISICLIPSLHASLFPLRYFLIQGINLFWETRKIPGTLPHYKNKFFQALIPGPKHPVANCTR